ncbi:hypothetical protein PI125_g3260 [Phytophthora idaei]|nr:hypothetical protein PI125_g3260 [Phytophthora idaei]
MAGRSRSRLSNRSEASPVRCVICMDSGDEDAAESTCTRRPKNSGVQLPGGHSFHRRCIHSWLQLQSTCPICRWKFPKEFAGRFIVHRLQSTAVLPEHIRSWPRVNIACAPVGGHYVRVVVSLTLEKTILGAPFGRVPCPCEQTVLLLDETSGEMFSEMDTRVSTVRCHFEAPRHRIASARFASLEETKFSDGQVSSSVARETGRKRRCFRSLTETSKRQRFSVYRYELVVEKRRMYPRQPFRQTVWRRVKLAVECDPRDKNTDSHKTALRVHLHLHPGRTRRSVDKAIIM